MSRIVLKAEVIKESIPWCAEIIGFSEKYIFERKFLNAAFDYSEANITGSRGIYKYYWLKPGGLYEVYLPGNPDKRYYCVIEDGQIKKIKVPDVVSRIEGYKPDVIEG